MSDQITSLPTVQARFRPPRQFQNIPIIALSYHLYASFHVLVTTFPKSERYSLGTRCQTEILTFIKLIIRTTTATQERKKAELLREASVTLDTLKLLFNLCKDCRCVSNQTYQHLESLVTEIGKMLGGWLKTYS